MEFFYTTELAVPMSQMVLLLICTTVALLFGRIKLALLVNYLFAFYLWPSLRWRDLWSIVTNSMLDAHDGSGCYEPYPYFQPFQRLKAQI
jgi:hypothetical protein